VGNPHSNNNHSHWRRIACLLNGLFRTPFLWRRGYNLLRARYLQCLLTDSAVLRSFLTGIPLPRDYGIGMDERCVEYPWFVTQASRQAKEYLDAGSTLNNRLILDLSLWTGKRLTILTLAPEPTCLWRRGISYQFADLRNLPFRDHWFDEIACLSTLEHVGMDNSLHTRSLTERNGEKEGFESALLEMKRVLKPGGRLLLSVPFGDYQDWGLFQQFDAALLKRAADVFSPARREDRWYRYSRQGWQLADQTSCNEDGYSEFMVRLWQSKVRFPKLEPDLAMGARAVACSIWERG
jgi:SAM-dependent methyltransferase